MTRVLDNEGDSCKSFVDRLCTEHQIHPSWIPLFQTHGDLLRKIHTEIYRYMGLDPDDPNLVFPQPQDWYRAYTMDVNAIRIFLLGQDPYHNPGQAMGYAFSVPKGVTPPPSLVNIFKEIKSCYPEREYTFEHGDLSRWALEEGIFLLNASLTVKRNKPGSHMSLWSSFTDATLQYICQHKPKGVVYLFLGTFAKEKARFIPNEQKDMIVSAAHPSPLSASKGFFGSKVFYIVENKLESQMNWNL